MICVSKYTRANDRKKEFQLPSLPYAVPSNRSCLSDFKKGDILQLLPWMKG